MTNDWLPAPMPHDLRLAVRQLIRAPGFAIVVILTLALGIGANTAIFSVVDAVLLRPLVYHDADRIVVVYGQTSGGDEVTPVPADFLGLKARSHTLDKMAGYREWTFNVRDGNRTEQVYGATVTADFFALLGVVPQLGRTLAPDPAGHLPSSELIIGEQYWKTRLNGAPDVLGRQLTVDGRSFTIVGVMPRSFVLPSGVQFWLPSPYAVPPQPLRSSEDPSASRGANYFTTIARIGAGASLESARQETFSILRDLAVRGGDDAAVTGATLTPIRVDETGDSRQALLILFGASAVLLLIGCANLANLFLADATGRQREWTVRVALGAGRWRLVRERLAASLLLAGLGGLAGLLVADWGVALLQAIAPADIAGMIDPSPDLRVLCFTALISLLTGIGFGIGPAWFSTRVDLAGGLRDGSRGASDSIGRRRLRGVLVIGEVGLAFVLAIGAVLLGKTFARVQDVATGLDPERVLTVGLVLPAATYPAPADRAAFARRLIDELNRLPDVASTSVISRLPLDPGSSSRSILTAGKNGAAGQNAEPDYLTAGPGYLRTLGIALLAGREFAATDGAEAPLVTVVSQAMAQQLWPGVSAVGQQIQIGGDTAWREVVGVVADVHQHGLDRTPRPTLYVPFGQDPWTRMTIVVRGRSGTDGLRQPVSAAIQRLDRDLAASDVRSMNEVMAVSLTGRRFNLMLIGLFAGSALLLATLGIYGVISYTVAQRTREVGIRMAIGARPGEVMLMIVKQGSRLALIGVTLGMIGALALTPLLRSLLYAITPTDPGTFVEVAVTVIGVALLASYLPARRATNVDPAIVLRSE